MRALEEAAECLRTIAHPHRLRMIQLLVNDRYTVGQLAESCGITSPAASGHLRLLRDRGFLDLDREGRAVYYRIAEPQLMSILGCIEGRFGCGLQQPRPGEQPQRNKHTGTNHEH